MSRGAGLGGDPDGSLPPMADRLGLRVFLRLRRRRGEPVLPRAVRRHHGGRAAEDAGGGLHADRGSRESRHHVDPSAEGADARQALLRLLRARRDPRAASRPEGVVGQVQGQVRRRLGQASRGDARQAEETGRHSEGRRADGASRGDTGLGRHAGRSEAGARPPDGDLRGLPRTGRPLHRTARRHARGSEHPRRHADLPDHRRQRRVSGGHDQRLLQRDDDAQRHAGDRDDRIPAQQDRRLRHAQGVQPLRRRLGARAVRAVPVDQAGRFALGRDAQWSDRALAEGREGQGRDPDAVLPRHRRGQDHPRGCTSPGTDDREQHHAGAARRRQHGAQLHRSEGAGNARGPVLRDDGEPRHLPQGLDRRHQTPHAMEGRSAAALR